MADFCASHKENPICEGLNGLMTAVSPIISGLDNPTSTATDAGSTSTTTGDASSTTFSTPQSPMPTPVPVQEGSTTDSMAAQTTPPLIGQSFITVLPTEPTSIPGALSTSTMTTASALSSESSSMSSSMSSSESSSASLVTPESASTAPPASGLVEDTTQRESTGSPNAVAIGLGTTVAVLVIAGAVLWWFCLRGRISRRRKSDESQGILPVREVPSRRNTASSGCSLKEETKLANTSQWAVAQNERQSWQPSRPPSVRSIPPTEQSLRTSYAETESNFPEPLSPRPCIQQTVQRLSVPKPVECSSFRNFSRQSSFRSSAEKPSEQGTVRKVVIKRPEMAVVRELPGSDTKITLSAVPSMKRKLVVSKPQSAQSSWPLEVPTEQPLDAKAAEGEDSAGGLKKQYTVRRGPLSQNPFVDPTDEPTPPPQTALPEEPQSRHTCRNESPTFPLLSTESGDDESDDDQDDASDRSSFQTAWEHTQTGGEHVEQKGTGAEETKPHELNDEESKIKTAEDNESKGGIPENDESKDGAPEDKKEEERREDVETTPSERAPSPAPVGSTSPTSSPVSSPTALDASMLAPISGAGSTARASSSAPPQTKSVSFAKDT